MGSMHCRLYDENLVHDIIISTGLAVIDFLQKHNRTDADEVCEYLEMHADSIIEDTIEQLNSGDDYSDKEENGDSWPFSPDGLDK